MQATQRTPAAELARIAREAHLLERYGRTAADREAGAAWLAAAAHYLNCETDWLLWLAVGAAHCPADRVTARQAADLADILARQLEKAHR